MGMGMNCVIQYQTTKRALCLKSSDVRHKKVQNSANLRLQLSVVGIESMPFARYNFCHTWHPFLYEFIDETPHVDITVEDEVVLQHNQTRRWVGTFNAIEGSFCKVN